MPYFRKLLALTFLILPFLFLRPVFAADEFYFQEEFNQERANNTLDSNKWNFFPNNSGCALATIKESGGNMQLQQCNNKPQFPYLYTKSNPFPDGNYSLEIKFQYTKVTFWGTGFALVDKAPENGKGFTYLFGVGLWQDKSSSVNMRISYDGTDVYTKAINVEPHTFKIDKENQVYKIYFDGQLVYTSPKTTEQVKALWFGNPDLIPSGIPEWTNFKVDYVRVKSVPLSAPEPFLSLPWDYGDKDPKQIILNPFSWFDHKYPLQNFCCDPPLVDFTGKIKEVFYKSHSGYDYSSPQGVFKNTPVLAAADGKATFVPEASSGGSGNMIKIDHGNGYQTWYEHLEDINNSGIGEPDQLIVDEVGKEVEVKKGDKIGRVGLTGNTTGYHIHLSVFRDLNANGDFNDDKPFGLNDPLGWEGDYKDPWEEYSVTDEDNNTKNGAKSYKLFTDLTEPKVQQVTTSGGTVTSDEFKLTLPSGFFSQNLIFKIEDGSFEKASETIKSITPSLFLSATNDLGQLISSFNKPLGLIYDYSKADLSNIKEDTISFYFFNTSTNLWEKIPSTLNKNNKTISSQTNHFSQFAVMGELLDFAPPTTQAEIIGSKGNGNWYKSNVSVKLIASDNPGGKGVSYTVYSLDNGQNWNEYQAPLQFTEEKSYKILFLSHDIVDNTETAKSVEFSIDKTPPEAKIFADITDYKLKVVAEPSNSVSVSQTPNSYTLQDQAGNTLTIKANVTQKDASNSFEGLSLKYNSDPEINLPKNILSTSYILQPKPKAPSVLRLVNQTFELEGQGKYTIFADVFKNATEINKFLGPSYEKQIKDGITLIQLKTNKGKLEFSY